MEALKAQVRGGRPGAKASRAAPLAVLGILAAVAAVITYQLDLRGYGVGFGLLALVLEAVSWVIRIGGPELPEDPDSIKEGDGVQRRPEHW
jgi:hypothetical protein